MDREKNKIEELEARLAVLENENILLSDRAEDTMLLGLFTELAGETSDYTNLLSKILERISIIKDITFCSCGLISDGKVRPFVSYCSCSDEEIQPMITLKDSIIAELNNGMVILEDEALGDVRCEPENLKEMYGINEILIFPFKFQMHQPAVFLFGKESAEEDISLKQLVPLLQQFTYIAEDRINTLYLLEELKRANADLENRVAKRTGELEQINKNLVEEIKKREEAETELELSEEKFREIFNNANDSIILWESNDKLPPTKCLEVNNIALLVTGYSREEFMKLGAEDLRDPDTNYNSHVVITELAAKRKTTFEVTFRTKDGRKIPTETNAHRFLFQGKNVVLAVHRDITERKEFEQRLIMAKEFAEESDKLKSAFLANMSHEIRTPMNAILGFTDLLQLKDVTEEDRSTYSQIIHHKGEELLTLINDILSISKIEADQIEINQVNCDLEVFFKLAEANWRKMLQNAEKENIVFLLDVDDVRNQVLQLDNLRLTQILNNLFSNAIKFTNKGSITVSCDIEEHFLKFMVRDTGIGIPSDKLNIVFDRFRQADESHTREYGGSGLGLAICKKLVTIMSGEIGVDSVEGEGAIFWFTLPLIPALHEE